jgi:hypothetical protein
MTSEDSKKRSSDYLRVDDEVIGSSVKRRPLGDNYYSSGLTSLGSGNISTEAGQSFEENNNKLMQTGPFLTVKKETSKENVAKFSDILVQPSSDSINRRQSLGSSSYLDRKRLERKSTGGAQSSASVAKIILETLSDLTSPLDDLRRKPVSLSMHSSSNSNRTNSNSNSGSSYNMGMKGGQKQESPNDKYANESMKEEKSKQTEKYPMNTTKIGISTKPQGGVSFQTDAHKQEKPLGLHVKFDKEQPKTTSSIQLPLKDTKLKERKQTS